MRVDHWLARKRTDLFEIFAPAAVDEREGGEQQIEYLFSWIQNISSNMNKKGGASGGKKGPTSSSSSACGEDPVLLHRFRGLHDAVTAVAFAPHMKQIAAASKDKSVLLWTFSGKDSSSASSSDDTNAKAFKFCGHSDEVLDVAFSPSGKLIASASRDKTVRIWVNSLRGESTDFKGHTGSVRSVEFSPGAGLNLVTGSDDKSVKVWTVQRHKFVASYTGHSNWVRCARYSPDGHLIASCSDDKTIRVFDERTSEQVCLFQEPKGFAQHLAFHPSGTCIGVGTSDKKVKVYDVRMQKLQQLYSSHEGPVTQVAFHASGNYLVSSSQDGYLKVFDLLEVRPIYDLRGHDKGVTSCAFSPRGEYMASGGTDNLVFVWRTNIDVEDRDIGEGKAASSSAASSSSAAAADSLRDRISGTRREIDKVNVLTEKLTMGDKENNRGYAAKKSTTPDVVLSEKENEKLRRENFSLKADLRQTQEKVETLTETLILMERRISLLEDQAKLSQSLNDLNEN